MNKRNLSAFIIILGSLGFFFWTVFGASNGKQSNSFINVSSGKNSNSNLEYDSLANLLPLLNKDSQNSGSSSTDNLTDNLIHLYEKSIYQENASGLKNINGQNGLKPLSENSLASLINESDNEHLNIPSFEEKDIKISNDNSKEAQLAYLRKLGEISTNNFSGFNKNISDVLKETISQNKTSSLEKYLEIASKQIDDLLALETPPLWKSFHLQNLNLWQKKLIVYGALVNTNNDPLKTILAIKEIFNVFEENDNLQKILDEKIKELNSK